MRSRRSDVFTHVSVDRYGGALSSAEEKDESFDPLTIADLYLKEKQKQSWKAFFLLLIFTVLLIVVFHGEEIKPGNPLVFLLPTSFAFITGVRIFLIQYRVDNGYFGNTVHEAQELIDFVKRMDDKNPPPGGSDDIDPFPPGSPAKEAPNNISGGELTGEVA